ncbi:hypothetical protein FE697_004255 [Mumia zhuanghuii]|uniref:RCC1-like domain-containing protein n=2 Tax=Mumia TaxID=1546255 RepID=A0ABW1QSY5_9ACTN|nr:MULTISPECIES: hypothetical protein [Mumia]KAA1425100.1 hypothetical protein FE697_004255 [Mumia zhuanghuii]
MRRLVLLPVTAVVASTFAVVGGSTPAYAVAPPEVTSSVAAGNVASVVIGRDGRPYGTGVNQYGSLTGVGSRTTLTPMAGLPAGVRAVSVAAAPTWFSLVRGSDGRVYGTGVNDNGQITGSGLATALRPLSGMPAGVQAVDVAAGNSFTLVLGSDGVVRGTGHNGSGQLTGAGHRSTLTPLVGMPAGVRAKAIAAGAVHSLVVGDNGVVYGAGLNDQGQLTGTGNRTVLTPLTGLPVGKVPVAVAAGWRHSVVLVDDGRMYGTGLNDVGQLTGTGGVRTTLTLMQPLTFDVSFDAVAVSAGEKHTVALGEDGEAYGVGSNDHGQVGGIPLQVTSFLNLSRRVASDVVGISATNSSHTLLRTADGMVWGLGRNQNEQLTARNPSMTTGASPLSGQLLAAGARPVIRGVARVGGVLSAGAGAWTPAATHYAYRWYRNGALISGATGSTYRLVAADRGRRISVLVIASASDYARGSAASASTATVRAGVAPRYVRTPKPRIAGVTKVGKRLRIARLSRSGFTPAPSRLRYQWYRGATKIRGATKATYRVKRADRGKRVRVRIIAVRPGHLTGTYDTRRVRISRR